MTRQTCRNIEIAVTTLAMRAAMALGPHELLLVVNERSRESWEIAREYAALRGVPPENLVAVDLPDSVLRAEADLSLDDFARYIVAPAHAAMRARGIQDRILAWAYSADLPVRIRSEPTVSLHGATLVGGRLPDAGLITTGLWISALFRGPTRPGGPAMASASLERLKQNPAALVLTPAMSLTWSGARGLDREASLALLRRSASNVGMWASGVVYLVTGSDVRAQARQWQFDDAAQELSALGIRAVVTSNFPAGARNVSGILMGLASPEPRRIGAFLPGAVADHLTSLAAVFHSAAQTKLTAWLEAGAYAAAGTVTEPYSIWTKFPSARLFAHLARGCTILEAVYQSVACPLQLFIVGDPLMAPNVVAPRIRLRQAQERADGVLEFVAEVEPDDADDTLLFLLDGRTVAVQASRRLLLDAASLSPGYHRLRAVVYRGGEMRVQSFAEIGFEWGATSRWIRIVSPSNLAEVDERRGTTVRVETPGEPLAIALFAGGRKVVEVSGPERDLRISSWPGGPGPVELQAVAVYADGTVVPSKPVNVRVVARNQPPRLGRVQFAGTGTSRRWTQPAQDPDGDGLTWSWWAPVEPALVERPLENGRDDASREEAKKELLHEVALADVPATRAAAALWAPISAAPGRGVLAAVVGRSEETLWCFGWSEEKSAWVIGTLTETNLTIRASRGRPARPAGVTRLILRISDDGALEGWSDDTLQCRWPGANVPFFRHVGFARASSARWPTECQVELSQDRLEENGRTVRVGTDRELAVRVSDGWTSVWQRVSQ